MATTKTSTNKTTESATAAKVKAQAAEISDLKAQIEQLQKLFVMQQEAANKAAASAPKTESSQPEAQRKRLYDEVTLVHLVERAPGLRTHIEISNLTIDLEKFGEERILTLQQAEEVISKYRSWFDLGIIALGADAKDVSRRYALKEVKEFNISRDLIDRLPTMNAAELEEFYNKLGEGHRRFIIEYWKRQCIKKKPEFLDIYKVEALNRISDGAMESVLLDIQVAKMKEARKKQ